MLEFFQEQNWTGYTTRDYRIMKDSIIAELQNPVTGIPEITDHSESNPFIKRVSIWCGIGEHLGYYIDNQGRECFLSTSELFESAHDIAKQYDYRVRGRIAATTQVTITIDNPAPSDITIPVGTVFSKSEDDIKYTSVNVATILTGETSAAVDCRQWTAIALSSIGTTSGLDWQQIEVNGSVADSSMTVFVDGVPFPQVETFALSVGTDQVHRQYQNKNKVYSVEFADGINGELPTGGLDVTAQWYETEGAAGNCGATLIDTLDSILTLPGGVAVESISNLIPASNGKDSEGLNDLKVYVPLSLRTLYRAVTYQDYVDVALLAPGVANAGLIFECGKHVDIYISPEGGGPASPILIADTLAFMNERKMVTTFLRVFSAGVVFVEHEIIARAKPGFVNLTVKSTIETNLEAHYSNENQEIGGTNYLGDVYEAIETSAGVKNSDINIMRAVPAAIPTDPAYIPLDWDRQQTANSEPHAYRITFTTSTNYQLYKDDVFVGNFSVGTEITTDDLIFTINAAAYLSGYKYRFNTYASTGNISLNEPSLFTYDPAYVSVEVTGGL